MTLVMWERQQLTTQCLPKERPSEVGLFGLQLHIATSGEGGAVSKWANEPTLNREPLAHKT